MGDQHTSDSEENCAFAFAVTENQEETCGATCPNEAVLEVNINGITTRVLIDLESVASKEWKNMRNLRPKALTRRWRTTTSGCVYMEGKSWK